MSFTNYGFGKTHYQILGLAPTCSLIEIKRAYKRLQLKHHPDKTRGLPQQKRAASEAISKAVNEAYEVLSDARGRRQYDQIFTKTRTRSQNASARAPKAPARSPSPPVQPPKPSVRPPPPPPQPKTEEIPQEQWMPFHQYQAKTTTNTLVVNSVRWKFRLHLGSRFKATQWGQNYTCDDGDYILIFIKLSKTTSLPHPTPSYFHEHDVQVCMQHTPYSRTITKIESYHKHRLTDNDGPETLLWIRLFTKQNADFLGSAWSYAWDVELERDMKPPNPQCTQYGTNLYFYNHVPHPAEAHPADEMRKDRDMKPREGIRFVGPKCPARRVFACGRVEMYRVAVFGYQDGLPQPPQPPQPQLQNPSEQTKTKYTPYNPPTPSPSLPPPLPLPHSH